jgi:hypothetical protein
MPCLLAHLPCSPIWRHNFNFTTRGAHTASLLHSNGWAPHALPTLLLAPLPSPDPAGVDGGVTTTTPTTPTPPPPTRAAKLRSKAERKAMLEAPQGEGEGEGDEGEGIPQLAAAGTTAGGVEFVRSELELLAEYQTLRRLRHCGGFVLFSIHTYISPFRQLERAPAAAQAMAAALRRKYRGRLHNRGVGTEAALRSLLGYLDGVTSGAGLEPGLLGVVQEPWERQSVDDGTGPGRDYRGKQTWAEVDEREAAARGR